MRLPRLWGARRRAVAPPLPLHPPGEAERLLRRLNFTVIRRLDGMRQGDHRNLAYGAGLDLAELREYQPGDDVRALDWNVTARMGQAYVRRYHEDREITAWLVLDLTASLDFGSGRQSKRDLLIDVAGTLARLLTARGDRVGALLYTGSRPVAGSSWNPVDARAESPGVRLRRHEWWGQSKREERGRRPAEMLVAGQGRDHVLHLLQRVLSATERVPAPDPAQTPTERTGTHLEALLHQAFGTAKGRSLIVVLSDFLDEQDLVAGEADALDPLSAHWFAGDPARAVGAAGGRERLLWTHALGALAQRHEVVGVWIRDPREEGLPDVGVVTFQDAETGEQLVADTSQPALRRAYEALAERRRQAMEQSFARSGAALWALDTAEPLVPALVRFLDRRRRTAVGARRLMGRPA